MASFVLAVLALVVFIAFQVIRSNGQLAMGSLIKRAGLFGLVVFGFAFLSASITIIGAGERGVVFNRIDGVNKIVLEPGLNFITPVLDKVIRYDVRVQKATSQATAASKDLQDVATEVTLTYKVNGESAPELYSTYGKSYVERVITPAVQESVKAITALYTAEELVQKRAEVKLKIEDMLTALIAQANISHVETFITNFQFSEAFSGAIEAKQIAEQNALKAKNDLDRIKVEAQQKIENAKAEATSLRLQRNEVTPNVLKLRSIEAQIKAIEKWNGVMPTFMSGGGQGVLLNLDFNK